MFGASVYDFIQYNHGNGSWYDNTIRISMRSVGDVI